MYHSGDKITQLEALLDGYASIEALMDDLSSIAALKADHLRENWQDEATAKLWEEHSNKLADAAMMFNKPGNPYGS